MIQIYQTTLEKAKTYGSNQYYQSKFIDWKTRKNNYICVKKKSVKAIKMVRCTYTAEKLAVFELYERGALESVHIHEEVLGRELHPDLEIKYSKSTIFCNINKVKIFLDRNTFVTARDAEEFAKIMEIVGLKKRGGVHLSLEKMYFNKSKVGFKWSIVEVESWVNKDLMEQTKNKIQCLLKKLRNPIKQNQENHQNTTTL